MKTPLIATAVALAFAATPALADDCKYKTSAQMQTHAQHTAVPQTAVLASDAQSAQIHQTGWKTKTAKADIVDIAAGDTTFSTLVAAVKAADLVDTLKSDGPFTVFAPTNAAFDALPPGTVESLLLPENKDALTSVLTYHVVPGKVLAGDLSDGLSADTANGSAVTFDLGSGAKVNGANIVKTDIMAGNGVIHVIDAVLLPPTVG